MSSWTRRAAGDQSGMTLVELLVSMTVGLLVMGAILSLLETTARVAPRDQERAVALRGAQAGLHRMVRELRQASAVHGASANYVDVTVTIAGQTRRVAYDCDKPRCLRRVSADASAPPTGGGETVLARLQNGTPQDPVFSYSPTGALPPTHMGVKIRVPAAGERSGGYQSSVVLDDGLALRNVNLGG